jgi:hypothetical protein
MIDIEKVSFTNLKKPVERSIDTVKIKIYPTETEGAFFSGKVEVYNKDKKIYDYVTFGMPQIIAFEYDGYKYIIISEYSGGAHCCFNYHIFALDQNNNLKLTRDLPLGNASVSKNSLVARNGKLYLKTSDDRFAYFYAPYAGSYSFNQYYLIKKGEIIGDNPNV